MLYSGGSQNKKVVAIILRNKILNTVIYHQSLEEGVTLVKLKAKPQNLLVIQTYALTASGEDLGKENSTTN